MKGTIKLVVAGVGLWLLVAAIAALTLLPRLPGSWGQWLLLIVFGPPVYVVLEGLGTWLGGRLFASPPAADARTFSFRRVGIAVLKASGLIAIGVVAYAVFS